MIFRRLIKKHKNRVFTLQKKFGISEYQVFWMGFGEGILIGGGIAFVVLPYFF